MLLGFGLVAFRFCREAVLRFGGFEWVWLFRDEFAGFACNLVVGLNLLVCVGFGVFCFRGEHLVVI